MKKLLLLFCGLSLLIGLFSGYFTSEFKYFYLDIDEPKQEITFAKYNEIMHSHSFRFIGDPNALKKEKEYNIENAIIIGIGSFAVFCILSYFTKRNEKIK